MLKDYNARERKTKGCVANAQVLYVPACKIEEIKIVKTDESYISAAELMEQKRIKKENYRKNDKRRDLARAKAREEREGEKLKPIISEVVILQKDKMKEDFEETLFDLCDQMAEEIGKNDAVELMKELGYYTAHLETREVKDGVKLTKEDEISIETEFLMFRK